MKTHAYIRTWRKTSAEQSKEHGHKKLSISHGRQVSALCNHFRNALHYEDGVQVVGYPAGAANHMLPGSLKKPVLVVSLASQSMFVCHP